MTAIPKIFPFSKLKLREQETLMWVGYNPTFHRFTKYGIAISDTALYLCSRAWVIAIWRRYPLADISDVVFVGDDGGRPAIEFQAGHSIVTFRTPCDLHSEEADFDRGVLSRAADQLNSMLR